jgi:hypothetical protein
MEDYFMILFGEKSHKKATPNLFNTEVLFQI